MSIALIITDGYGNGTLTGTPSDVILHGFSIGNIWTEITDTTTTWTEETDTSTTWTEIPDTTTTWT